jgi:hypothetical protein
MRAWLAILVVTLALGQPAHGQTAASAPTKVTVIPGLHLLPVPEVLYSQLPQLPRGQGLVVDEITPDTLATKVNLQRHDVLLTYDGQPIRDADQFNKMVRTMKVDQKAPLVLLRSGKEVKFEVALNTVELATYNVRGAIKPGGPPSVAIECTPLDGGKLQVVLAYYAEKSSKLQSVTCTGTLEEIEQQVRDQQLPSRIQELVDLAIKRLREKEHKSDRKAG